MKSEIFRFVAIRPAQDADPTATAAAIIDLDAFPTTFAGTLRSLRSDGDRADMTDAARALVVSAAFIDSPKKFDSKYADFGVAVRALTDQNFWPGVGPAFTAVFKSTTASALVKTDAFTKLYGQVSDSIVAATIDRSPGPKARALLDATIRVLWLIRRLAASAPLTLDAFASAPLVMPAGIFPLPPAAEPAPGLVPHANGNVATELTAHRQAVEEVLAALRSDGAGPGFVLAEAAARKLSEPTRQALAASGFTGDRVDVVQAVSALESRATAIGTGLLETGTPGPCPPAATEVIPDGTPTVPAGHGDAKILGIADLNLLEQQLLRYELGEIAHIENVLKSETRSRTFRTSSTTEVSTTTETETTQTKEQDLASTERFALQTETQTVINDTASKQGGLTIHASYGPSVDATSNFNFSSGNSRQQSSLAASTYAREVTTKAVNLVQTRTLTRRVVTTTDVVEETNLHSFDNKSGNADIVGVYRFVNKVYQAQVVNYGKRLMLEFLVPEPAAFLRFALTGRPQDGVTVPEPDRPGNCVNGTFVPLQPSDITRDRWQFWAGKYGATDVAPPPSSLFLATASKKSPDEMPVEDDKKISSDLFDVPIPDGYLAQSAFINIFGETQKDGEEPDKKHALIYQVQDQQGEYREPTDDQHNLPLRLQPSPTVTVSLNSKMFHNYEVLALVLCTVSDEKFQDWQLKSFNSVMGAYADEKSRFDQAVAEAKIQAQGGGVGGTNPDVNRETEQTELKKGCLELLTGQRFDVFDAVRGNIAPFGYPEVDFAEARAEGPYIQMFEQSFEWNNMTYLFYPYFWGRKAEWPAVSQLGDDDPLFTRFLRAGAARVQVPVRLGFENGILTYLSTGELWNGNATLVNSDGDSPDPLHLSVLDELKSQTGDNNVDGVGTVNVTKNSVNVAGTGTAFTDDDEDRRIQLAGKTYVIRTVLDAQTIKLASSYTGDNATGLGYSMGGKLIGQPWEVTLPTDLVRLDNSLVIS
ncbi:hypothetical protein ACIA5C_10445 [Actinoplanes sp. NPDC051343]|uniref:hypothetical protein n=1 Tax=Actinoplanes sp. NPDC051343 TaxID=3363906 RepID=UPI0037B686B4